MSRLDNYSVPMTRPTHDPPLIHAPPGNPPPWLAPFVLRERKAGAHKKGGRSPPVSITRRDHVRRYVPVDNAYAPDGTLLNRLDIV